MIDILMYSLTVSQVAISWLPNHASNSSLILQLIKIVLLPISLPVLCEMERSQILDVTPDHPAVLFI